MKRLTVNINDETAAALESLAAQRQTTVTETVRLAVSLLKHAEDETHGGREILLGAGDGHLTVQSREPAGREKMEA